MLVESLADVVEIGEHPALLLLEPLQLALDAVALLGALCFLQRGLQLLEPLVDVLLAAREFLEPRQRLEFFAFLGRGHRLGFALVFVIVLVVAELELVELALVAPAAAAGIARLRNIGLARLHAQQGLVGALSGGPRDGERLDVLRARRVLQAGARLFHEAGGVICRRENAKDRESVPRPH